LAYELNCPCGWVKQAKTYAAAQEALVRHRLDAGPQHEPRLVSQDLEAPGDADAGRTTPPALPEASVPLSASPVSPIEISYRFAFGPGQVIVSSVRLQPTTFLLVPEARASYPAWTALIYSQCPNCPWSPQNSPLCPPAVNLIPVLDAFTEWWSCEQAEVTVTTPDRTITKQARLHTGLAGLVGLIMATSGCPILDRLRPLALTHLPFGGLEETLFRVTSMYALGQAFRHARGLPTDWSFTGLVGLYTDITIINHAFVQRLATVTPKDAILNALIHLDCYAQYANPASFSRRLAQFEPLFDAYWPK